MRATSQPFSSQQSRIQSCIATNWANFLNDPALIPPRSVTFCCIGLFAQDSMGPGVLWVLFDEATEVRTAGDYHKLWQLFEAKIHQRKLKEFDVPFPEEISETSITRTQMAEIACQLYCFLMIPWRKILQGKAAFTDSPSSSASLVHLMLNFGGKLCILWSKTAQKTTLCYLDVCRSRNQWIIYHLESSTNLT